MMIDDSRPLGGSTVYSELMANPVNGVSVERADTPGVSVAR